MNRREQGEELYRQKFEAFGLSERFVFLGRDWESDHGHYCEIQCKECGTVFKTWNVHAYFRKRVKKIICPKCRMSSSGAVVFPRSQECDEAMVYYASGHSALETANKFGVTVNQIVNCATNRKISNVLSTHQRVRKQRVGSAHRHRARVYGCQYDPSVTLESLIKRDGLRCAICGEMCDQTDKRWNNKCGAKYPTIDHIIPMSKGGGHTWDNVQVAHAICNSLKSNKIKGEIAHEAS